MANWKERRQWYIEHGICVACGQRDAFNGRQKCEVCLEKATLSNIKYYSLEKDRKYSATRKRKRDARIAARLCPNCGRPAVHGQLCLEHYAKKQRVHEREKQERRDRGNPARLRVQNGMCWFCETQALPGKKVCAIHYEQMMKRFHWDCVDRREHPWAKDEMGRLAQIRA